MTLVELLRDWLPLQRWYAGRSGDLRSVAISADRLLLDGDPQLHHVVVTVDQGGALFRYQLLLGGRRVMSARLEPTTIGVLDDGVAVYDAVHDSELTAHLLRWMVDGATVGGVTFALLPGTEVHTDATSLVLNSDQSNTSLVFGEDHILKLFRRVAIGLNPDLEITRALTEIGSHHVPALQGWAETEVDGTTTTVATLHAYLRSGTDGWALATTSVRDLLAEGDLHADEVGGDFAAEAKRLGAATAEVHAEMAASLPVGTAGPAQLAELAAAMRGRFEAAARTIPGLAEHAAGAFAVYERLANHAGSLALQRIHGDYHLGQALRTELGWVLFDFEGEPGALVRERAALASPLRDVAGMLRSFDYAAHHLLVDRPHVPQLDYRAVEWTQRNCEAFCGGYAAVSGYDPRDDDVVLRAFQLDKAVYEVIYESSHRPAWVAIPLGAFGQLTE